MQKQKNASDMFHNIITASVRANPMPKPKAKKAAKK
jgi:hypothetical protein